MAGFGNLFDCLGIAYLDLGEFDLIFDCLYQ